LIEIQFAKNKMITSQLMQEITLTLSIDEANLILEALSERPFKEVFSLINKIQQQASNQIQSPETQIQPSESNQDDNQS